MVPFHKLYLKIFSSLDFDVEKNLLLELKREGVANFLSIKRSWIYALKLSFIALLGVIFMLVNAYIGSNYFDSFFAGRVLPISYLIISILLFVDTFWYIYSYKKTHKNTSICTDVDDMIRKNDMVNKNFIKFFNISVLVSFFLFIILLETFIFLIFFYSGEQIALKILELFFNLAATFVVFKHRRLSMNLELDFGLTIPGKIYVIDQTGLLSSKQSIVAVNIKTVEGVYHSLFGSIFGYGDVKFFLEGNIPDQKGVIELDYISNPRKTVDLINKIL